MNPGYLSSLSIVALSLTAACSSFLSACGSEKEAERASYLPDDVPEPGTLGGSQATNFIVNPQGGQGGRELMQEMMPNMPVQLPVVPQGIVSSCFGAECPAGECEAEPEVGEASCATTYRLLEPGVDSLCPANSVASFCLNLVDGQGDWLWAIKCGGAVATSELCTREDGSAACESMLGGNATCGE